VEGPCLVEYRDGRLAQAYIPPHDVRIQCAPLRSVYANAILHGHSTTPRPRPWRDWWRARVCDVCARRVRAARACRRRRAARASMHAAGRARGPSGAGRRARCAMETHNVRADRLSAPMTAEDYKEFVPAGRFQRSLITALPFFALALAYAATQLAAFLKARPGCDPRPAPARSRRSARGRTGRGQPWPASMAAACRRLAAPNALASAPADPGARHEAWRRLAASPMRSRRRPDPTLAIPWARPDAAVAPRRATWTTASRSWRPRSARRRSWRCSASCCPKP
jgi:hypothetical protein